MAEDRQDEEQRSGEPESQHVASEAEPEVQASKAQESEAQATVVPPNVGPAGEPIRVVTPTEHKRMNRRQLLKLVPVVAVGAFAIPKFRQPLLDEGLALSDWASGRLFSRHRLAQTFSSSEVVPFERFPYNFYDVADPGVDLDTWTLKEIGRASCRE